MPVALLRDNGAPGFAPVARPRFFLGPDLDCDLVDASDGVAPIHATIRYRRGEFLLKAEEGCSLWVRGERVRCPDAARRRRLTTVAERRAVAVSLARGGVVLAARAAGRGGVALAPGVSPMWSTVRAASGTGHPWAVSTRSTADWPRRPTAPGSCKHLAPIREPLAANEHLRFLAGPGRGAASRPWLLSWTAGSRPATGRRGAGWPRVSSRGPARSASSRRGTRTAWRCCETLRQALAAALRHLHHRGIVHRAVAPDNVIVSEKGPAVLIDYGARVVQRERGARRRGARGLSVAGPRRRCDPEGGPGCGTPGPAEDVYGLAAVGFALLTGAPPARGEDIRATLIRTRREQPARWRLDVDAARVLIGVIQAGLSEDPGERPDAVECMRTLAFGVAHAAVGALR